jgi:hypothetical protein
MKKMALMLMTTCALAALARAHEGNGQGHATAKATPCRIGGTFTVEWGDPALPFTTTLLLASDGFGPSTHPIAGTLCLDIFSPAFSTVFAGGLDANGRATVSAAIPNLPALVTFAPAYVMPVVVDFTLPYPFLSIPKTLPIFFENPDSYTPPSNLLASGGRALHTATALSLSPESNRTSVLIAGGGNGTILAPTATNTTEIYEPIDRTFTVGPTLLLERALHTATLLPNGTVLIVGGADNFGVCHAACEIYDPATQTTAATGSMASPRAGHAATLLANGKVLVTGGVTTFAGGQPQIVAILNSALNTGEIYDPATGVWTATGTAMSQKRFGAAHTLLQNGFVLVSGGINGGTTFLGQGLPTFTNSCNLYDPIANVFTPTGNITTARAGHGASLLANGDVLATGGIVSGLFSIPTTSAACTKYNTAAGTWSATGVASLPTAVALHTQTALPNGDALVMGGVTGTLLALGATAQAGLHNGTTYAAQAAIGTNPGIAPAPASAPRGSHTCTQLYDGSFVVIGGTDGTTAVATSYVHTR